MRICMVLLKPRSTKNAHTLFYHVVHVIKVIQSLLYAWSRIRSLEASLGRVIDIMPACLNFVYIITQICLDLSLCRSHVP